MRWTNTPSGPERSVVSESGVIDSLPDDFDEQDSADERAPEGATVVVYAPCERPIRELTADTKVQLRYLEDGKLTLPVFTSLENLVTSCGQGQPWIGIPIERVDEFRQLVGADLAVVDPMIPAEQ